MSNRDVETDLLAAVYNDPDADAMRLVYMGWWIERREPRGEFIVSPRGSPS